MSIVFDIFNMFGKIKLSFGTIIGKTYQITRIGYVNGDDCMLVSS